jgi:hypothetical protein
VSRKYNTKHNRRVSNYPERLRRRGLGKTPVMETLETLRKRQRAKEPVIDVPYAGWDLVDMSGV